MKRYLKILVSAVLIGGVLAFLFYKDIKREVKAYTEKEDIIYVFQVGVYKNYDNALTKQKVIPPSIIVKEEDYYRVFIGAAYNASTKDKLVTYFDKLKINYYIKEIKVNAECLNKLSPYEEALVNSSNFDSITNLNASILEIILAYLS